MKNIGFTLLAAVVIGTIIGINIPDYEQLPEINPPPVVLQSSDTNCLYGCPLGKPENKIIKREIYTLSNNRETKFADWVAYHVTKDTIGPSQSRNWKADPDLLDEETLEPDDYKGANAELKTDRGHQVPLASFSGTEHWAMTNYLSNITPQKSNLNQGAWVKLENAVRETVLEGTDLYVMTGPIYDEFEGILPNADEDHSIPSGYWKVITTKDARSIAFIFDQDLPRSANYCDQILTLSLVEELSGLNIHPEIENISLKNDLSIVKCP
jgi:endonuclease G